IGDFVPGFEASQWVGLHAPRNTPSDLIDRLNAEINAGLADPRLKARFAELGGTVLPCSPADFSKLIAEDTEKWGKVIRFSGAKPALFLPPPLFYFLDPAPAATRRPGMTEERLFRRPHRLLLPAVPGAALIAGIAVAQGALPLGDIVDRAAEPERDGLQARVHLGVDRADRGALHVRPYHDVAVAALQRARLVAERARGRPRERAVAHQHVGRPAGVADFEHRHADVQERSGVEDRPQRHVGDPERDHAGRVAVDHRHHI